MKPSTKCLVAVLPLIGDLYGISANFPDDKSCYGLNENVYYGTPHGDGPQYGSDGGDQYGYGPGQETSCKDLLVLQVGVGSAVSTSLARQIENAVDRPDRVEGAGVAALESHLARPVVVDPVLVA
jgi:hypothetical protein